MHLINMAKLSNKETTLQRLMKIPPAVTATIGLITVFVSIVGGWTAQNYRVATLETQIAELKKDSATHESLEPVKEQIKGLEQKFDAEMQGIQRELSLIEKKL
jgi:hypothetical protein